MLRINYFNKTDVNMTFWKKFGNKILKSAYNYFNFDYDIELSITFVDDLKAQQINKTYRNHSYIADVTSFPVEMSIQEIKAIGFRELGDMFINLSEAKRKAVKYNHDINAEMGFLFVHGFLHLLGYDHEDEKDEKIMFELQDQILRLNNLEYIIKFNEDDYLESN
ncbi:rRNA maturation RNase YbeY [Mycoplasma feriruminatoris]|uniref:rRNA maturation RNase YbeY n=1 Tax=Mycoplasma feriruminatoris TaxID=1179777 RepID=UPI00241C0116|nr:rRNA maturation RNase YbeY [Mycoplasma feriruminatoris]WFQ90211.1 Endoribonuclease YbeY [Mycoplasma feriruminatoris]WFQ91035.1 endoribonuclease YbeY [Mycoplasma feriruminatoris]WFQ94385.1 Endoribonuclease YbeY [Mycoplasma feriruminatoris]